MSEFHRMITYLYLYEQGTKSRNIGFAKVEKRDQRCLLEIHMKNTGCSMSPVPVYFYVRKEKHLAGILLGNFSLIRGSGDFKAILEAENLKDSGYALEEVKGIYIPLTERMILVSQWDDDDFRQEDFVDLSQTSSSLQAASESTPARKEEESKSADTQYEKNPNLPDIQKTVNPDTADIHQEESFNSTDILTIEDLNSTDTPKTEDMKTTDVQKPESVKPTDVLNEENHKFTDIPKEENLKSTDTQKAENPKSASVPNTVKTEVPKSTDALKAVEALPRPERYSQADKPESWDLRWRFILENYPVMTPFAGDEHTICVRMELKDLRQLPKQFWYFGNNSFLLHGFFNYRYFILGMTEEFGVKKWFIGVPGVFQNPERVMAALFGFPEFRSEKLSPINTGEFGYWYRYLNELSEPSEK